MTRTTFLAIVWEWVDFVITGAGSQPQAPSQTSYAWQDFPTVTNWGNTLGRENIAPKNASLNSSNGVGRIWYNSSETETRALVRGGSWGDGSNAGAFAVNLNNSPANLNANIGFRCAR